MIPTIIGAIMAVKLGKIIALREPVVLISTALAASGFTPFFPSLRPGISRNCLLTSSIIAPAATPTACIVIPEKMKGKVDPINTPIRTSGFIRLKLVSPITFAYAAIRAKAVNTADPIANPLPVAAVVFPRASSASVLSLTSGSSPACSAKPPALSATGPYASVDRVIPSVASIPTEDNPMPYNPPN